MNELTGYLLGEVLTFLLYKTARVLVPLFTGKRVIMDEWEDDIASNLKFRFGYATNEKGQGVLYSAWGIFIGAVVWFSLLILLILTYYPD